jgi:hypothetical protein
MTKHGKGEAPSVHGYPLKGESSDQKVFSIKDSSPVIGVMALLYRPAMRRVNTVGIRFYYIFIKFVSYRTGSGDGVM